MKPALQRIAYVLRVFPKFSETFIISELAELRRRGVEVRILALKPAAADIQRELVAAAGLDRLTCYEPEAFLPLLQEFRPQLLHAHFATEATATDINLAAERNVPFTFTAHGYDIHRKPPPDFAARASVAGAVVTVSRANADYLTKHFGLAPEHIRVIPCGVDTNFFRPAEAALAQPVSKSGSELPLILCVARHVEVKNLGLLLQACAWLRDQGSQFRCIMLGDGPGRAELEKLQTRLRLETEVQMLGATEQSEVLRWWQRAAVGVLTSNNEGMPVSLMEAAACGIPVVSTAVGGVPEMVQDGVTGLLVPPREPEALGSTLRRLLSDGDLRVRLGVAARRRAEDSFSVTRQVERLLALWTEVLATGSPARVFVSDPFNALADPDLPTVRLALEPDEAKHQLKHHLPRLAGEGAKLRLKSIHVVRHKPGRRCVIEYELRIQHPAPPPETVALLGKIRVRRFGKEGYRLQEALWNAGFDDQSTDGISVPEPVGVIPRFQMWLQLKVPGVTATRALCGPDGVELARRIANAIHKLHQANIPTDRRHTMAEELRILRECLAKVAAAKPEWHDRLTRVARACEQLGASLPESHPCGIHRDFYPAQVVADTEPAREGKTAATRLYLIDFDLYCIGDPGLDVGNFIGHMTEQSLREFGDPRALIKQERALEERFLELSGESLRTSVKVYTTLTLVRHIYLSAQLPERQSFTSELIDLCEQRLGLAPQR
jgi:glycosyltransferase involved in cell wall biosynthesis